MRRRIVLVAGILIVALVVRRAVERDEATPSATRREPTSGDAPTEGRGDTFAFEAAARFNEGISANVDSIDTSVATILAGNVALLVLGIDKIRELALQEATVAATLMGVSSSACIAAYIVGFPVRASNRDGARPRTFIPDLTRWRQRAMSTAIFDLIRASEENLTVRFAKKSLALFAIVLLLAGAVMIALARLRGHMVY